MGALFFYSVLKIIPDMYHYRSVTYGLASDSLFSDSGAILQSLGMSMIPDVISYFQHIYLHVNFQLIQTSNQLPLRLHVNLFFKKS